MTSFGATRPLVVLDCDSTTIQDEVIELLAESAGTRELVAHESYRLVYEIDGSTVWVLALVHTARRWPPVTE